MSGWWSKVSPKPSISGKLRDLTFVNHTTGRSASQVIRSLLRFLRPHRHTMSKTPRDSTRFTATGVWAHTKPGGRATTLQFADPAPKNETPQQKVKRLREAANRAKLAQVTRWDYMYLYGRMAADAAHRTAVYGIVFVTGTNAPSRSVIEFDIAS